MWLLNNCLSKFLAAHALIKFVDELKLPSAPRITADCRTMDYKDVTIRCYCSNSNENNSTVCHVTYISTAVLELKGGRIDQIVSMLTYLEDLDLGSNHLHCVIPESLGNLKSLVRLNLRNNFLKGPIPLSLGNLSSLEILNLNNNRLSGGIPKELGNLSRLIRMCLEENQLTGNLPSELGNLRKLVHLDLSSNYLDGILPPSYSELKSLHLFGVAGNKLNGQIPNFISKWTNLTDLILRSCSLNGPIPDNPGVWPQLTYLDLSFNQLTGGIPKTMNVTTMILTENMLQGSIPPSPFPDVTDDSLFINCGGANLSSDGKHYDSDTSVAKFYEGPENVRDKRWAYACSGEFLSSTANSSDYIKNKTCGVSGESLHETARLCPVSLTYYGFCLHKGDYNVKLHFAEIVYAMDEDYSSSGKRVFDVYIQGERKLKDFSIKDDAKYPNTAISKEFVATVNDSLLEIRFQWAGKGSIYSKPLLNGPLVSGISVTPNFTITGGNKLSTPQIVGITVGSVFAPFLLLAFMWQMGWLGNRELQEVHVDVEDRSFTLKQIIDATQNFSPDMVIGKGRFGVVYKAELSDQNHQIKFAVKKISPESMQDKLKDELHGEIFFKQMKSLKHENVIQLFGGYSRKDLHLLIYEYMEKGSLHQALFDPNSRIELDWKVRFDICLGLAKALKYLHEGEGNGLKILHRNIKASNILLDKNFTAKLTDFGWARVYNQEDPFMTIKAGGARIYVAPEYALGQPITDKADVYSFGVVALEIFSGRASIENKPNQESAILIDDARIAHAKGRIYDLVDRRLINYDRKKAFNILKLAVICINPTADLRPTMSEVVSVLKGRKRLISIQSPNFLGIPELFLTCIMLIDGSKTYGSADPFALDTYSFRALNVGF
ncbi:hypothetical protein GH714_038320 [Hevea brasiliensis]|uniref:non-specific serine/threonine protein kinase n=1 Tax=Hevea brasiliensis TaxID=3981 RepID=A0A6A6LHM2_HEVBR|nr:hypothetical protein GH714_038320 [Hevea brasiliensis]